MDMNGFVKYFEGNKERFPEDFMFQLTRDEVDNLVKCQIVTSRTTRMFHVHERSGSRKVSGCEAEVAF